ncbi:MAG TPA: HlyD family efflux transporter periplasmic adaptor subunit [Caulifigura sp.]|nr:HlyD family efflux transporter periplasmic adaptor subunit [Caulifigura sp.]
MSDSGQPDSGSTELVVASSTVPTAPPRPRPARKVRRYFLLLLLLGGLTAAAMAARSKLFTADPAQLLTCRAKAGPFVHEVTERGELESSANLEVRCNVESRDGKGMKILQIVPEGTIVKEGDLLFKLDDSTLRNEKIIQQIAVNAAESAATQAKNELEAADFAKREYELGTFIQEEEKAESELFVARENLHRAEEYLAFSRKLESRGYSSTSATEADKFAVEKCRKELGVAETKLNVLRVFTKSKLIKEHDSKIRTADAKLKESQAKFELESQKLAKIEEQLAKCVVYAPRAGQVVYDHDQDMWRGEDYAIKEGTVVYERRVVIRLPEPTKMQVKTKVAESKIDRMKKGMPATITIEGQQGMVLEGKVVKVNDYPAQGNWYNQSVKEYETIIEIVNAPPGLRPGMSAQVAVRVESLPEALQVPVQAVAEIEGQHYCLVRTGDQDLQPRAVKLGSSNDKFLMIRDGVKADEELLLDPRGRLSKMTLPKAPAESQAAAQPVATAQKEAVPGAKPPATEAPRT